MQKDLVTPNTEVTFKRVVTGVRQPDFVAYLAEVIGKTGGGKRSAGMLTR